MKRLIARGELRWPNLPSWEGNCPPVGGEAWDLDGSGLSWVLPSGMVALAVKALQTGVSPTQLRINPKVESYAMRMGLHKILGHPEPDVRHHGSAGERFTELSTVTQAMAPPESSALCQQIASVMSQGNEGLRRLFEYILGELVANVRQHAGRPGIVMAQAYPTSHEVEFAIGDWGIGIRQGLSQNPNFALASEHEALELAIRPNTSGKDWAGAPGYGTRENSGNGLFTLSFLAREAGGKFLLASGGWALYIWGERTRIQPLQCAFPGTLVSLRFPHGGMDLTRLLGEASKKRGLANRQDDLIFE